MKKTVIAVLLLLTLTACSTRYIAPEAKAVEVTYKKVPKCGKVEFKQRGKLVCLSKKDSICIKELIETTTYNSKICKIANKANVKIIKELGGNNG